METLTVTKRNAFGTWLLVGITFGIYALVMYERLNRELHEAGVHMPATRPAWSRWWSQLIPVYGIIGIHKTAQALNTFAKHTVVSPTASWLFWSWFFVGTYPYLQIGANRAFDRSIATLARRAAEASR